MNIQKYRISQHALLRMAQRNIELNDLLLVLQFGRKEYRTGVVFYFLGERDLPSWIDNEQKRLIGTTAIVKNKVITTVYRNPKALRKIKRKSKHYFPYGSHKNNLNKHNELF